VSAPVETYHRAVPLRTDYETPAAIFDPLNAEFRFTLDVCATRETAKCPRYFTPEDDGLAAVWDRMGGACWMNPPYGRAIGAWMRKAWEESRRGAVVVCLVPARTDTSWWHTYAMRGTIRYLRGRIAFVGEKSPAPFPSAIVIFCPGREP